jgi:hypothetical protein
MNPGRTGAIDSERFGWRLRNGVAVLGYAAGAPQQVLAVVLAVLFGGLAWLALATIDKPERVSVALFLAGLAVAVLWGIWFSRLVALHAESRQARMPLVDSAIAAAIAFAVLATAVLPGLLLAFGGIRPGLAVCAMTLAACVGVLMATLPRMVYLLLCFAPLVIGLVAQLVELWAPGFAVSLPWRPELADIGWLVLPAAVLTAWRWRAVVRAAGDPAPSPWWQPVVMVKPGQGADNGWFSGGAGSAHMPDWMWPAGQTTGAGPHNPVRAMRALVGTPFAPLSAVQALVQLGIGVLAFAYLLLGSLGEDGDTAPLVSGAMGGLAVLVVMYGQRLDAMYRKRSAELDELALLPGFGDAQQQRACLARAVSWSPAGAVVAVLVLLLAMAAALGMDLRGQVLMLMAVLGVALMMAIACLRPLAGLRLDAWRMLLLAGPGLLLAMITMLYAAQAEAFGRAAQILAVLWVISYVVGGLALASTLRRFRARPHPFLPE